MARLYYITHPDVKIDPNIAIEDWELSEIGRHKVLEISKEDFWNDIDIIISSPEMKAFTTAKLLSEKNKIDILKKDDLREFDRTSTGFLKYEKYMENMNKFYQNPNENVDGWESANEAQERVVRCIEEILDKEQYKSIAVIGHGATATLYKCHIKNVSPSMEEDPKSQGRFFVVDLENKEIIQDWKSY